MLWRRIIPQFCSRHFFYSCCALLGGVLVYLSTSLYEQSWAIFFFAVPLFYLALNRSSLVPYVWYTLWGQLIGWTLTVFWIKYVHWSAVVLLVIIQLVFKVPALILSGVLLRKSVTVYSWGWRLVILFAAASTFPVSEYILDNLFNGMPSFSIATSQWKTPEMLSILPYTGYFGLSALIMFINLALSITLSVLVKKFTRAFRDFSWVSQGRVELIVACTLFAVPLLLYKYRAEPVHDTAFKVAVVQPYIEYNRTWDQKIYENNLEYLGVYSEAASEHNPDFYLWPESALPTFLNNDLGARSWLRAHLEELGKPIHLGCAYDNGGRFRNAAFIAVPNEVMLTEVYFKRKLVPFTEYHPPQAWASYFVKRYGIFPGIDPGEGPVLLNLPLGERVIKVGPMICSDDLIYSMALENAKAGAELLSVITNDIWFGDTQQALQHASHSVLRAAETRRPLVRCGNNGWSGWIDPYGRVIQEAQQGGSIFFRGYYILDVAYSSLAAAEVTPFVRYGAWFPKLSMALMILLPFVWRRL